MQATLPPELTRQHYLMAFPFPTGVLLECFSRVTETPKTPHRRSLGVLPRIDLVNLSGLVYHRDSACESRL